MKQYSKQIVLATFLAAFAFAAVGCGGGGDTGPKTPPPEVLKNLTDPSKMVPTNIPKK